MSKQTNRTLKEILTEAREAENIENIEEAIRLYQLAISTDHLNEDAYNRLMVIFRKLKDYKKELHIIKEGIKVFEEYYESRIPKKSKTITSISNKLNKSFGLADKKGNSIYSPEPIAKWKKRKLVVEKKLK